MSTIDAVRAWLAADDTWMLATHSVDCWQWHPECMAVLLLAEIDRAEMLQRQTLQAVEMATRRAVAAEEGR
jgi:hypothetical protein